MSTFTADAAAALTGPDWLRARRGAAAERLASTPLPTDAEEVWRYSRIAELDLDRYAPLAGEPTVGDGVPPRLEAAVAAAGPLAGLLVLRNGRIAHRHLDGALAAGGVVLGPITEVPDGQELLGAVRGEDDAFTALNDAFLEDASVLHVPAGVVVDRPVLVLEWIDAEGAAVPTRTIVRLEERAEATVCGVSVSADVAALAVPVIELQVGDAAHLRHLAVQDLGTQVWQVGYALSRLGRDSTLSSSTVVLGGDYARLRTDSRLEGQGGMTSLQAVYFGDGDQMHDFRTLQDHAAPRTQSDLLFKGAVEDRAQSVYTGLIRVRKGASGTNAFQTNRNLVLSDGAHADSVPNLEIEENDVRCSHASAVGPIDEDQRYYLESRGVPPAVAERLIVLGFFDQVLDRTPVVGLRELLRGAVARKLTGAG